MKLREVIIQGKFCGLNTIEECVTNFYLYGIQLYPYNELEGELRELRNDLKEYESNNLVLPWDEINREVTRLQNEYEEYLANNPPEIIADDCNELEARLNLLK